MADTLMVVCMVGFIVVCIAYTKWCDHIIGPDEPTKVSTRESEQVA